MFIFPLKIFILKMLVTFIRMCHKNYLFTRNLNSDLAFSSLHPTSRNFYYKMMILPNSLNTCCAIFKKLDNPPISFGILKTQEMCSINSKKPLMAKTFVLSVPGLKNEFFEILLEWLCITLILIKIALLRWLTTNIQGPSKVRHCHIYF